VPTVVADVADGEPDIDEARAPVVEINDQECSKPVST
jgi:hypothetical protein